LEQYDKTQASEQQHQQAARQTLLDDHQAEIQTLHNDHKQEIQTLHDDYNTEMTRLIDLVSDLEESLAETQAATYTKECERSALEKALHDLTTTGSTQGLKDTLVLVTQERDGLRDQLQAKQDDTKDSTAANLHHQQQHDTAMAELQQQHDTAMAELQQQHDKAIAELRQQHDSAMADLQQQLDSAVSSSETKEQGLGVLTDSVQRLEQHRANLQSKLDEKDDTLQRLEHTLIAKDKELETARLQKNETIQARMDELQAKVERVTTMYAHIEQKATQAVDEQQQRADLVLAETRHAWRTQVSHLTRQLHQEHGDWIHVRTKSPSLGLLPPLVKPAFTTFLETPRCSGCQSGAIDI
jgi:chromosome segregation ATPase